ncbi:MAG: potassium/proton antiporter [Anaerolineae bacterium]|nr:potassium/proton antiporter [Anaerolineae bacterium]
MIPIEHLLLIGAILLLISIGASRLSSQIGIPALLAFLAIGMLAGSEGLGGIYFDDAGTAQYVGVVALALILFSGGLDTEFKTLRPILRSGLVLSSLGVLLTAGTVGLFAVIILRFSPLEGVLLGAIVSSTDAAAVFAILRTQGVNLRGKLEPLLELESGSNDPMAILLTIGLIRLILEPATPFTAIVLIFAREAVLGFVIGIVIGQGAAKVINRIRVYDGLYPVFTVALAMLAYGLAATVGGNGFLAVYLAGLLLGRANFIHKRSLQRFHDGLAWLMQILMFLTLGLLVFPSRLIATAGESLLIAIVLIVVARPLSIFVSLSLSRFELREKLLVAWVGLRGAAPIILATFPLLAGIERSDMIFNIVFFVVLLSVAVQGTTIVTVARWLKLEAAETKPPRAPLELVGAPSLKGDLTELVVFPDAPVIGRQIVNLALPEGILIVLVGRGDEFLVPNGSTILEANDRILVLADAAAVHALRQRLESSK